MAFAVKLLATPIEPKVEEGVSNGVLTIEPIRLLWLSNASGKEVAVAFSDISSEYYFLRGQREVAHCAMHNGSPVLFLIV